MWHSCRQLCFFALLKRRCRHVAFPIPRRRHERETIPAGNVSGATNLAGAVIRSRPVLVAHALCRHRGFPASRGVDTSVDAARKSACATSGTSFFQRFAPRFLESADADLRPTCDRTLVCARRRDSHEILRRFLNKDPKFSQASATSPERKVNHEHHVTYIEKMRAEGKLVTFGPILDGGDLRGCTCSRLPR